MNRLAGVVILYYPDKAGLLHNIQSYIGVLDVLYVIDNTGVADLPLSIEIQSAAQNIKYIVNPANLGIAPVLNAAAALALADGYNWLLTMDQDSYFEENQLTRYMQEFIGLFYTRSDIAVVAPSYLKNESSTLSNENSFKEVNAVITSGSLVNLDIWNKLNGFDEKLFIDEVDNEYCYRAIQNNYRIILFENIYFEHVFGKKMVAGYFGLIARRSRIIHSPVRVYFMVRNYLYVRKKYIVVIPDEFSKRDIQVFTFLKNNLFFSGHCWKNVKSIIKGYRDFKKGNFSSGI